MCSLASLYQWIFEVTLCIMWYLLCGMSWCQQFEQLAPKKHMQNTACVDCLLNRRWKLQAWKKHWQTHLCTTTYKASIKKSKWGTKQGHSASPCYSPFALICAIICMFSLFVYAVYISPPPGTRNAVLAVIRYKYVLDCALLKNSPYSQIIQKGTSGLRLRRFISPLVSNGDKAVVREQRSKSLKMMAT